MLVLIGPASIVVASLLPGLNSLVALVFIAFTFGGVVAVAIFMLGKYSGAVINPALTLAAVLGKAVRSKFFIPYVVFQTLGGLLAGITLRLLFLNGNANLGSTELASGVSPILGIVYEAIGTFVLASSALIASAQIKKTRNQALLVGGTLFALILLIGPLTGAGFNPARSLGPSLASGYTTNLYVYFVGPIIGALLAGLLFRMIRNARPKGNLVCLC